MAGKKEFRIATPRGSVFTVTGKNGSTTARLEWAPGFAQKKAEGFSRAQAFVDSECLRYMNPLTPRRTGMLIKSGTLGTVVGSGSIEYVLKRSLSILFSFISNQTYILTVSFTI